MGRSEDCIGGGRAAKRDLQQKGSKVDEKRHENLGKSATRGLAVRANAWPRPDLRPSHNDSTNLKLDSNSIEQADFIPVQILEAAAMSY